VKMSSLTVSVVLLAAIAIVVVAGYNLWLMRRRQPRPRGQEAPAREAAAATSPSGRAEPSLGLDPASGDAAGQSAPDAAPPGAAAGQQRAGALLDAYTDCIVELPLSSPVGGERLVALTRGLRRAGSKPVTVEAAPPLARVAAPGPLAPFADHASASTPMPSPMPSRAPAGPASQATTEPAGDASTPSCDVAGVPHSAPAAGPSSDDMAGRPAADAAVPRPADPGAAASADAPAWRVPVAGGHYAHVRVGVLLANRHGPMNAMEFSEFVAGVQGLADQLSVLADTPDMAAVLARARALDELCASLAAQVGIGVETREPLGLADLARVAGECGCVERGNNRYARLGPGGEVLFSLALADAPNRLSLLLDVPRAPAAMQPWQQMLACAQLCAQRLDARLVDDAGRPLPEAHLARIEQQIAERQRSLDDAGFAAGAPLTLRLFN